MQHHKGVININGVPTVVETWGRWIEETPTTKNEDIILCIPGNPGVTGYYKTFLETIYKKLQCPVWIIGHAGHQLIQSNNIKVPGLAGHENLYSLQGQVENKEEFIKKYIPADARIFLVGHSIGSYISLNLLKNPEFKSKVVKSYLLFPTIEDMGVTPNGKFLNKISYITTIIFFLTWIFFKLPDPVQNFLLYCYFVVTRTPEKNVAATKDLMHPAILNKIFFMGFNEMTIVKTLDPNLIEPNINIVKLYYGATDNWAPVSYYEKLKLKYPNVNAEVCVRNFSHAFVLRSSVDTGNMVANWIETDK